MRPFRCLIIAGVAAFIAAGCSSSPAPVVPASIVHHSAATLTGTVGQPVVTLPAVRLVDASDQPTAGVTVNWTITAGNGTVGGATSTTNSDGVATVASWTLGTVAEVNRLRASTTSLTGVEFEATAAAGNATGVVIHAGNEQAALVGQVLPIDPAVKVVDQYGNGKPGVRVVFAVAAGGGFLTGSTPNSGNDGVATLGSWRLGASAGTNLLTATVTGLTTVQLSAAASLSQQCSQAVVYTLFSTVPGTLLDTDCLLPNTFYHDFFQLTVPVAQPLRFNMQAPALDPYVLLIDMDGNLLGEDDDGGGVGTTASSLSFLAAPGEYLLLASTAFSFQLGTYTISSAVDDGQATNCELIFAMRGITIAQNLTASDCFNPGGPFYSDQFFIRLNAGTPVTIGISSTAFDTFLELYGSAEAPVASNDNISATNLNSELTFVPTVSGYYVISASSFLQDVTGPYTLTIAAAQPSFAPNSIGEALFRMGAIRKK